MFVCLFVAVMLGPSDAYLRYNDIFSLFFVVGHEIVSKVLHKMWLGDGRVLFHYLRCCKGIIFYV